MRKTAKRRETEKWTEAGASKLKAIGEAVAGLVKVL